MKSFIILLALIFTITATFTIREVIQINQNAQNISTTTNTNSATQPDAVTQQINKLVFIPDNSQIPVIININPDLSKRANPVFFKDAQKQDLLISYDDRQILYRPSTNQIVNIKIFSTESESFPSQPLNIAIRFGSTIERAEETAKQLKLLSPNFVITEITQSTVEYQSESIYLLNPNRSVDVSKLSIILGNSPINNGLTPGEKTTNADAIVIFK